MGTLIRHARLGLPAAATVIALTIAMIEPSFGALLVAAVGAPPLVEAGLLTALGVAVALSAIAVRTDPKRRLASLAATNSRPEHHFSMNRHTSTPADFDNGNGSCQGKTSFDGRLPVKVATPEPRCFEQRGSLPALHSHNTISHRNVLMQMIDGGSRLRRG